MNPSSKAMRDQPMGLGATADMPASVQGDTSISNSSLELLEQHQAREQARLLQRFRELREWQQQQQQQLMHQQQQQLRTWQDEQSKVQTLIANQGGKTVKPSVSSSRSPLMTPPTKPKPSQGTNLVTDSISQSQMAGISLDSGLVVSMQDTLKSQSSLPKPVMYPSLTSTLNKGGDNDDDKYTNSELFSNLGSHDELLDRAREVDDDAKPLPDWMSDSSENVLRGSLLPPQLPIRGGNQLAGLEQLLKTAPAGLLQQMLGILPGGKGIDIQGRGGRTSEDVELSASPTLPQQQQQQQPTARRLLNYHTSNGRDESQESNSDSSPVEGNQQHQAQQSLQQQQQQEKMLLLMQQRQRQQSEQQQQQQQHQLHLQQQQQQQHQFQMQQQQHTQQRPQKQMQQHQHINGLMLGPAVLDSDVDPRFVPRAFNSQDNDMRPLSWGHAPQHHSQGKNEEQDDDGEEDNISYEDQNEISADEDDDYEFQASKQGRGEDRPISGTGGKKTFEQLLEEQLQQEKEEQLQQKTADSGGGQRKVPFLKKGEGIARFNSAPKKPPPRKNTTSKSQSRSFHSSDLSGELSRAQSSEGGSKKSSIGSRLKSMGKQSDSRNFGEKRGFVRKVQQNQSGPEERPVAKLSLIRSVANKKMEEQQKHVQQEQLQQQQDQQRYEKQNQQRQHQEDQESSMQPFFRAGPRKLGDLSTIIEQSPSLDGRSIVTEDHDSTELDSLAEFEVLEEAADNMSLCSSSSLVGRLVYGDKQGQKEAVQKLKTITESLKSARSEGSSTGLDERESRIGSMVAMMNNNSNNNYSNSNNNYSNSNNNYSNNDNNYKSTNDCNGINGKHNEGRHTPTATKGLDGRAENQSHDSSEVTLTDSSDDEDAVKRFNISHQEGQKERSRPGTSSSEINRADSNTQVSGAHMPSPSKALTRKVAPLSSKFNTANDTLSLLKSLSAQANLLTTNPPSCTPTSTSGEDCITSSASTSAINRLGSPTSEAVSQGLDFFSGTSTLPANFFSTAARDGILLSSAFGASKAQTFQPSSSVFTPVPSSSSSSSGMNSIAQHQKNDNFESQLHTLNGNTSVKYKSQKYAAEMSDEETNDSGDEVNSQSKDSDKQEENREQKNTGEKENPAQNGQMPSSNGPVSAFDDESAWEDEDDDDAFDNATTLKTKSASSSSAAGHQSNNEPATPPTSRLVSKLFPKLRPKPSAEDEKKQQSLQEASSQPVNASVGIQSGILREKLKELDVEIEKFRSENSNLEKLRREREEGLAKLKKEIENFQKEKESELNRLEEFKAEEMKKLKRERKLFESYQKKLRSMPDKREREEIENLKMQLQEAQDELKRKESRWTASTARLKNRVAELELENGEVKEEVRILERKRLEWMTSQAGSGKGRNQFSSNGKVGGPASIGGGSATQMRDQSGPRSSTPTGESGLQASTAQTKDGGRQGSSVSTKAAIPTMTPASSSSSSNYNNSNNNNIRGRSSKNPTNHNINNNSNSNSSASNQKKSGGGGNKTGVSNGLPHSSASLQQQHREKGMPASTASLVAPSIPVTVLSPPAQQQQPQFQQQNIPTPKEGGDGLQTMQNTAVPVMMECTIPAGTEVSKMPGLQTNQPSPEKSAARQAIEKAVVDKGDPSVFTENLHQDGKLEKTFRTGAKEIRFPNGTVKEISADGQTIVCRLANGDIRQILPDHRVVYIFSDAQIMQTTFPDGLETFQFQNGQIERRYPDGTVEITFPSKDIKYLFPDGGQEVILTDGTVMQYNSQGERTVEYPSGDREVHTAEFQRREFPDGIIKTIYADGRHETRFPNGRVRMRDKEGNVVMDQIVYR